jgi:hypothetical protein
MTMKNIFAAAAFGLVASTAAGAQAGTFFVDAKDNIFLAGQSVVPVFPPEQTQTAVPGNGAGLLPYALNVTAGETLHLTATGTANCGIGCNDSGPAGNPQFGTGGIAGYGNVGPYTGSPGVGFQLLGVFNAGSTPWAPFVIGAGGTFVVPTGATKLYLGLPDGFSFQGPPGTYNDNTGGFTVAVPEPATWAMMIFGFGMLGFTLRRRRAQAAATA